MSDLLKIVLSLEDAKIDLPYSVLTTDINEIRDGDLVDVSYHFGDCWATLGEKGTFHETIKSVRDATIGWSKYLMDLWGWLPKEKIHSMILPMLKRDRLKMLEKKEIDFKVWAGNVCVLQYYFGQKATKTDGIWFNIMRTQEQIDRLKAIDEVKKSKKQEKRQRQKEEKQAKKQEEESKKRLFVRIKLPQPGAMCRSGFQVVKSFEKEAKPSFYDELGWFDM